MAKTFKRIAALATAIALVVCFAVSASAINVATTTQYAAGGETNVNVTVNVTDAGSAAYVTYYAQKDAKVVYVDQVALNSGSATIKYQTAATDLKGTVKVGYTGGAGAENKTIDANTITYDGGTKVLPTEATTATITMAYTASEGKKFDTVTADTATVVSATESEGTITVVLSGISTDVALTVVEKAATAPDANVTFLDAAAIKVTSAENAGDSEHNKADVDDRKLTVIGQFTGTADEYGIAVSTEEITSENIASATKYKALGANASGVFAVQLIDEGADEAGAVIASGTNYYVAIYALVDDAYVVDASADVVTVE